MKGCTSTEGHPMGAVSTVGAECHGACSELSGQGLEPTPETRCREPGQCWFRRRANALRSRALVGLTLTPTVTISMARKRQKGYTTPSLLISSSGILKVLPYPFPLRVLSRELRLRMQFTPRGALKKSIPRQTTTPHTQLEYQLSLGLLPCDHISRPKLSPYSRA